MKIHSGYRPPPPYRPRIDRGALAIWIMLFLACIAVWTGIAWTVAGLLS